MSWTKIMAIKLTRNSPRKITSIRKIPKGVVKVPSSQYMVVKISDSRADSRVYPNWETRDPTPREWELFHAATAADTARRQMATIDGRTQ